MSGIEPNISRYTYLGPLWDLETMGARVHTIMEFQSEAGKIHLIFMSKLPFLKIFLS